MAKQEDCPPPSREPCTHAANRKKMFRQRRKVPLSTLNSVIVIGIILHVSKVLDCTVWRNYGRTRIIHLKIVWKRTSKSVNREGDSHLLSRWPSKYPDRPRVAPNDFIHRHQRHPFNHSLCDQEAVEWILVDRRQPMHSHCMAPVTANSV